MQISRRSIMVADHARMRREVQEIRSLVGAHVAPLKGHTTAIPQDLMDMLHKSPTMPMFVSPETMERIHYWMRDQGIDGLDSLVHNRSFQNLALFTMVPETMSGHH